ncbi:uncharacterized protein METZ01_LOCUS81150, partial [marine metagenome]
MKKIIQTFLPIFILSSQVFAIAGFGAYGDFDLLKYRGGSSGDISTYGVEYKGFENAKGFGFLFYIDAIPVVDLEADIEFVGNLYEYTPYLLGSAQTSQELPWGRVSTYVTIRKEILGLSIPLLAKAQLYGGLGFNKHKVIPIMTEKVIKEAFNADDLETALNSFGADADPDQAATDLAKSMLDNVEDVSGFHLQAGVRG